MNEEMNVMQKVGMWFGVCVGAAMIGEIVAIAVAGIYVLYQML